MLTIKSGISSLTGYQAQLDVSNTDTFSKTENRSSSNGKRTDDTVDISSKARELETVFQREKTTLEQNYNSDAQQLEREYFLEKNRIEREYIQKKRSLEISVYA